MEMQIKRIKSYSLNIYEYTTGNSVDIIHRRAGIQLGNKNAPSKRTNLLYGCSGNHGNMNDVHIILNDVINTDGQLECY